MGSYADSLCPQEWFSPESKNATGKSCLSVALQNPYTATVCEAGMTALSQLLDKYGKVFRDGSMVQIVFISDAQDPGCPNLELQRLRPSPAALKAKVLEKNKIINVKFHGVLPVPGGGATRETQRDGGFGYPYNQLIKESSGVLIDITKGSDYSIFAKSLASKTVEDTVLDFPEKIGKVKSITVDGKELDPNKWTLSPDEKRIILISTRFAAETKVVVEYFK